YLADIRDRKPAAVILGCTHYPLLAEIIKKYLPESVLISSGAESANDLKALLEEKGLCSDIGGRVEFYTSGGGELFTQNAYRFLGSDIKADASHIDIETY
ncbi:MAG: glutamate racemase, partial [Clostridia bacterium]|nr:glutamate racemase [Clostridia bacterium]